MAEEKREWTPEEQAERDEQARRQRAAQWVRGCWGAKMARLAPVRPTGAPPWVTEDDWETATRDLTTRYRRIDAEDLVEYLAAPEVE